jgi:hypothetical protein
MQRRCVPASNDNFKDVPQAATQEEASQALVVFVVGQYQ